MEDNGIYYDKRQSAMGKLGMRNERVAAAGTLAHPFHTTQKAVGREGAR